jgi:hypothetical protein
VERQFVERQFVVRQLVERGRLGLSRGQPPAIACLGTPGRGKRPRR